MLSSHKETIPFTSLFGKNENQFGTNEIQIDINETTVYPVSCYFHIGIILKNFLF